MAASPYSPPACASDCRTPWTSQRATVADDGAGGQTPTWANRAHGFCFVASQGGTGERMDRDRLTVGRSALLWMRHGNDVTEKDRMTLPDGTWIITQVENWRYQNSWLRVTVEQGPPVNE